MATTEKIRLFQFEPAWGLPSASPFCLKLETFLRMNRLPFEVVPGASLDQSPKGGLPYIEFEGRPLGDSGFIIAFLKQRFAIDPDARLRPPSAYYGRLVSASPTSTCGNSTRRSLQLFSSGSKTWTCRWTR